MVKENTGEKILPVILGTDLNAYTMAASFHEKYGVDAVLVGKLRMHFTEGSSIIQKIHYHKDFTEPEVFRTFLSEIATIYKKDYDHLILIGVNDIYVNLIISNQDYLSRDYLFNYLSPELRDQLFYKKNFYKLCEEHGLDIPQTEFYNCKEQGAIPTDLPFPLIVKPSNVVEYQERGLHAEHKLFKVEHQEELEETIKIVVDAGYKDDLIIQEYVPGDDHDMWDAVYYGNQDGKGQLITLGQVVLQERAPHLIGAYTAVLVRYNEELMTKLAQVMEKIGYKGFANFDMKYDARDGKMKLFEVNIRQGRSSYYIDYCGEHLSKYFVDDLVFRKEKPLTYLDDEFLFTVVPKKVLKNHVTDTKIAQDVKKLLKQKKYGNPLIYKKDRGFVRILKMYERKFSYIKSYKEFETSSPFYNK